MWIIALEALVALGMLILIVWLTMGGSRKRGSEPTEKLGKDSDVERRG